MLDEKTSASQEILEMYSFGCSHCFRFEQVMSELKQDYQLKCNLRKVNLSFLISRPKEAQNYATEYFYVAKKLKREKVIVKSIFDSLKVYNKAPESKDEFDATIAAKGINTESLKNTMDSPAGIAHVKQNNEYLSNYKKYVTDVPMLVVNGLYKVNYQNN